MLLVALLACPILAAALAVPPGLGRAVVARAGAVLCGGAFVLSVVIAARVAGGGVLTIGPEEFLRVDGLSAILALVVTGTGLVSLWFEAGAGAPAAGADEGVPFRRYHALAQLFVFTMLLAVTVNNVGIMWVAIEATTIITAFLVGLRR